MECKDHLGNEFKDRAEMTKHWGISKEIYSKRIIRGLSVKEALTTPVKKRKVSKDAIIDHTGKEFKTIKEMTEHWGITYSSYLTRKRDGLTTQEALTRPARYREKKENTGFRDHLGNVFDTKEEMTKHYNLSVDAYNERLGRGLSVKDALTLPKNNLNKKVIDHEGNEFESQKDMVKYWGITQSTYSSRIKSGMSIEKALSEKVRKQQAGKRKDHLGNEYGSLKEMLATYDITESTYFTRKQLGWDLKKILESPKNERFNIKDHLGNEYSKTKEMLEHYGISETVYNSRLRVLGWDLEKTLTTPIGAKTVISDHLGNEYKTLKEMLKHYDINKSTYDYRKKYGWDIEKILTTPVLKR